MILVDTSVWIDHFRRGNASLAEALDRDQVLTHPFIIGELACGDLKKRRDILDLLHALPQAMVATDDETLRFIETRRIFGKGIGYIDAHLLASVALTEGSRLWTLDRKLVPFADAMG